MPDILDWRGATDPRQVIQTAASALAAGRLVAFPTETVYGIAASALVPEAVERLSQCKGRPADKPLTLAIGGAEDALDWVPGMSPLGRRLARRCWPGPVTLVYKEGVEQGLSSRLPEAVRRRISPQKSLGLRTPAHDAVLHVLHRLNGPLALSSANRSGAPEATTAEEVIQAMGDDVDLVVDGGPSRYGRASTVVRVDGNSWSLLREGVVSAAALARLSCCMIVFVCTGNTCRSPLAEVLFKKFLAERLGCTPDELPQHGFIVLSAGLTAVSGGRAASEAVTVARELGADLSNHASQPLTAQLVAQADHVFAMTRSHLLALSNHFHGVGPRPRLLCPQGSDIADPIGCDQEFYRECARQILSRVEKLVPEVQQP